MLKKFITLEWKAFVRSASFQTNLFLKILMALGALYFILVFGGLGISVYFLLEEAGHEPFAIVNTLLIFYVLLDLILRFFFQKTPVMNIRPLLPLNLRKNSIVAYSLGKTLLSFFNWIHLFFLIPFCVVLVLKGFDVPGVVTWFFGFYSLLLANNFINILSNNNSLLLYGLGGAFVALAVLQYYHILDLGGITDGFFLSLYELPWMLLLPLAFLFLLAGITFRFFRKNLYLDAGLAVRKGEASTESLDWLNQFGSLGTFLKNDIKLLKRNKRSRTTLVVSGMFIFYGLLFFTDGIEMYDAPVWKIFAGIFVSGGFLFTFGQLVPSWDSAYYPLMMSQNIKYREYLNSKWWLMVIATLLSTVISTFYLYFGWEAYLAVLVGAIYNIGVNAHVVLWAGAFIKTPIDLTQNKNAFGNKQAFNMKTLLLTLPKLLLPLILYAIGHYLINPTAGYLFVALSGVIGFAFKNKVFSIIEGVYKSQKYETLAAYKQKN